MKPILLIAALGLSLLAGCAGKVEPQVPPKELTDFNETVSFKRLWSEDIGSGLGRARYPIAPALDGNTLFAGDARGNLYALDAISGKKRWVIKLDAPISSGLNALENNVYLGTRNGEVLAIDQANGKVLWRSRVASEVLAPPQANSSLLVVQSVDGSVTALDRSTGQEAWVYTSSEPSLSLRGTGTPSVVEPVSFVGLANGRLVILDNRTGQPLWDQRLAVPQGRSEVERLVDLDGEPVLTQDGRLYVTSYQGKLVALEATSGQLMWERAISSYLSPLLVGDTLYVVNDESHVLALDAISGQPRWESDVLEGRQLTAPALASGKLVLGDFEGYVHVLDRSDGSLEGRIQVDGSGISLRPLTDESRIYALANDGELDALEIRTP
ncbi:outer membrane protein assembly factor BamB [Pistricoccus aurantiacus]|uniref:outer membrane protein assembly factor BamB n=1 Tax=Pistricoccus aurantiacus TaxID=1883414 RepID=UPI00362CF277